MKTIALINGNYRPNGQSFAEAASPQMRKAIVHSCDDWMPIGEFYSNEALMNDPEVIPVLTTLVSPADRLLLESRRKTLAGYVKLHTALFDHPHNSGKRDKAGRLCMDGITVRYKANVPPSTERVENDWNLKPWLELTDDTPRRVMHCPSNKQDEYALFLQRDEPTSIIEVNAIVAHLNACSYMHNHWQVNLRPWQAPDFSGKVIDAIRNHYAVIDGNSVMLLDSLREGRYALVWEHPGKPLAHVLASYWPCTLDELHDLEMLQMEREPLFEFLDNIDIPFDHLHPKALKRMIEWQLTHLDTP